MAYLDTSGLSTRELDTNGEIPNFLTINGFLAILKWLENAKNRIIKM